MTNDDWISIRRLSISTGDAAPQHRTDRALDAGGLPLGIKPDTIYETETATLETGDWLVVFTDAVVEAVNEPGGLRRRTSDLNPQRQCENIARPASWLISTSSLETRRSTMTSPAC